jgi:hypothetical protein
VCKYAADRLLGRLEGHSFDAKDTTNKLASGGIMDSSSARYRNLVNLLILFLGGYVAAVFIAWVVLLVDHSLNGGPESALSILTPAGLFILMPLASLFSLFFFIPLSAILGFSLLAIETSKPKKKVVAVSLAVFIGGTGLLYAIWGGPAAMIMGSSLFLAIWLGVGLLLVIAFRKLRPSRAVVSYHKP